MMSQSQFAIARRSFATRCSLCIGHRHPFSSSPAPQPSASASSSPHSHSSTSAPIFDQPPLENGSTRRHASLTSETILSSKRTKGFGRKLALRALNRGIVRKIARRATIGIPLLGLYFACRVLANDYSQAKNSCNSPFLRKMYAGLATVDAVDVMAQTVIISSLAASLFLSNFSLSPLLDEMGPIADKVSLGAALVSSSIGTYSELVKDEESGCSSEPE